jgi:hypothetical protein
LFERLGEIVRQYEPMPAVLPENDGCQTTSVHAPNWLAPWQSTSCTESVSLSSASPDRLHPGRRPAVYQQIVRRSETGSSDGTSTGPWSIGLDISWAKFFLHATWHYGQCITNSVEACWCLRQWQCEEGDGSGSIWRSLIFCSSFLRYSVVSPTF